MEDQFVAKIVELSDGNNVHISEKLNFYPAMQSEPIIGFLCIITDIKSNEQVAYSYRKTMKEVTEDIKYQMEGGTHEIIRNSGRNSDSDGDAF